MSELGAAQLAANRAGRVHGVVHVDVVVLRVGQDVGDHAVTTRELCGSQARVETVGRLAVLGPGEVGDDGAVLASLAFVDVGRAAVARRHFQRSLKVNDGRFVVSQPIVSTAAQDQGVTQQRVILQGF